MPAVLDEPKLPFRRARRRAADYDPLSRDGVMSTGRKSTSRFAGVQVEPADALADGAPVRSKRRPKPKPKLPGPLTREEAERDGPRFGSWTDVEDAWLLEAVHELGPKHWCQISKRVPGRIGKQCRERWHSHLSPGLRRGPFEGDEQTRVDALIAEHAPQWALIAKLLDTGRCDNQVKNYAHVRGWSAKRAPPKPPKEPKPPKQAKRRTADATDAELVAAFADVTAFRDLDTSDVFEEMHNLGSLPHGRTSPLSFVLPGALDEGGMSFSELHALLDTGSQSLVKDADTRRGGFYPTTLAPGQRVAYTPWQRGVAGIRVQRVELGSLSAPGRFAALNKRLKL